MALNRNNKCNMTKSAYIKYLNNLHYDNLGRMHLYKTESRGNAENVCKDNITEFE